MAASSTSGPRYALPCASSPHKGSGLITLNRNLDQFLAGPLQREFGFDALAVAPDGGHGECLSAALK